jgi:hypothetical protein
MRESKLDHLIAVPSERAATLAGISERRLKSWSSIGLVRPASERRISSRNVVRLYAFS